MSENSSATVFDFRVRSDRATRFGRYPMRRAASITRSRVPSLMRAETDPPANTRLTVLMLVRVSRAMSISVAGKCKLQKWRATLY